MIPHGSPEWIQARLGIPTCSQYARIVTPTGKPSGQADRYMAELCAEWLLGQQVSGDVSSPWMTRGTEMEPEALAWYCLTRDVEVVPSGLIRGLGGWTAGTPDGFVGDDGIVEIKCNSAVNHVAALLEHDANTHKPQIHGYLWLTGRPWLDRVYYAPSLPPVVTRFERDEEYECVLSEAVAAFVVRLQAARAKLLSLGCTPYVPPQTRGTLITEVAGGYEPTPEEEAELIAKGLEAVRK